jgi:hypothetical protein
MTNLKNKVALICSGRHLKWRDIERLFAETIERFSCIDIVVANTVT